MLEAEQRLPDLIVACVGGGSNAIGFFHPFLDDDPVEIHGVEAAGSPASKLPIMRRRSTKASRACCMAREVICCRPMKARCSKRIRFPRFDIAKRTLDVEISKEEMAARLKNFKPPALRWPKGVFRKYVDRVNSASEGATT